MNAPAIRLRGVSKRFGKTTAVRDLDLEVPPGSIYGLIGPNGAGKTTAIRIMLDIIGADLGTVEMFGTTDVEAARSRVGYLPEERGLYPKMSLVDHLVFFGELKGMSRSEARRAALEGLEEMSLIERADDKVETLSKGMAQKAQFLGTVLHRPDLLILDEPFSGLDPLNVDLFKRMILERQREGVTVLFSTHMIEDAERLCERVCMIAGATKVLDGRVGEVKSASERQHVALAFEGDGAFLERSGLVDRVADHGRCVEARLAPDADPQRLLELAVASGVRVSRFELVEPSLREIFIEKALAAGLSAEDAPDEPGAVAA
ncbi:MAG: ATP-binding cassette domain-containing protein [Gemmatimonadota bacterium]|nr:ATP-binding cassette domain-containing protein [Gemmatimonadota bacterium]